MRAGSAPICIKKSIFRRICAENNAPATRAGSQHIRAHPDWKNLPVTFEFWTTAPISDEMLALFEKGKAEVRPTRYTLELRGPAQVFRTWLETCEDMLIRAYEKHFTLGDGSFPPLSRTRPARPGAVEPEPDDWS